MICNFVVQDLTADEFKKLLRSFSRFKVVSQVNCFADVSKSDVRGFFIILPNKDLKNKNNLTLSSSINLLNIKSIFKKMSNNKIKKAFSLVEISIVVLIIGLLVAGISKASDMIFDAEIKALRSLTKGSRVNRIPNLVLWLETTSEESMNSSERVDGGNVSYWSDINPQATSKIIFKNFKSNTNVKYVEAGINGNNIPLLSPNALDNANDYFVSTTMASTYSATSPNNLSASSLSSYNSNSLFPNTDLTIFVVVAPHASADIFSFCTYTSNACDVGKTIKLGSSSNKIQFTMLSGTSTNATALETAAQTAPYVIVSAIRDKTGGSKIFVNGTNKVSETTTNTNATMTSYDGIFRVGPAKVFEVIAFSSRLTDVERYAVEEYLGKKYSITTAKTTF
ncbi:MAG: prepilin-type N-terminal cleavage/methylation domain-containing protein [Alphaproteobacteria bacterium]|nr:prepilin-type N-terminal cleavage/methylation domain-containing protein [Alphaproteobacteria bacterium]